MYRLRTLRRIGWSEIMREKEICRFVNIMIIRLVGMPTLPYFGKRKQVTYHQNLSY